MTREETLALVAGLRDLGVARARLTPDGAVVSVTFCRPPAAHLVDAAAELAKGIEDAELSGPFARVLKGDVS